MLKRNRQLALKIESTEGVAETLAAADADMLVYDPSYNPDTSFFDRRPARGSMSALAGLPGIKTTKYGGKVEVRGSGSAGTAPSWGKLLRIAGLKQTATKTIAVGAITGGPYAHNETITGGTSTATGRVVGNHYTGDALICYVVLTGTFQSGEVITGGTSGATSSSTAVPATRGFVYDPTSTESEIVSATAGLMDDGVQKLAIGSRATIKFSAKSGEPGFFEFEIMGTQENWTDVALFSSVPYETTIPPVFFSAQFTLGTYTTAKIESLSWDMGNSIVPRSDVNAAGGIASFRLTDRLLKGQIDPELTSVAAFDWHSKFRNGTTQKLIWRFSAGATAGLTVQMIIPEAQFRALGDGDRSGLVTMGLQFEGSSATIEREICIVTY